MLLRVWMVLVLAVYPALVGWVQTRAQCQTPATITAVASTATHAGGCCAVPATAPSCCATKAVTAPEPASCKPTSCKPVTSCTAAANEGVEADCPESTCCPIRNYCRGPCRHAPGSPLPPVRRDTRMPAEGAPLPGGPSHPLIVAVLPPRDHPPVSAMPRSIPTSTRLATLCLRTI
jgi:hypothetical protein